MKTILKIALCLLFATSLVARNEPEETVWFPGSLKTWVQDFNARGQVVGIYYTDTPGPNDDYFGAYLYYKGEYTDLRVPGAFYTFAYEIDNRGTVRGLCYFLESGWWEFACRNGQYWIEK